MDKKELAELVRQVEDIQTAMAIMQRNLASVVNRLKFIPVSQSSASSSDDDCGNEYHAGMRK